MRLKTSIVRKLNQAGDTIVEVLIAVGIVSLVLTTAYATTNRNVRSAQDTQENIYAQKLVEQQAERLRAAGSATGDGCFTPTAAYVPLTDPVCKTTNGGAEFQLTVHPTGSSYEITASWKTLGGADAKVTVWYRTAT